ncbi:hypothetical protein LWI28_021986 [Acer negundo]|uniref:Uncharacterized protein n=1 Tax=Acer negundo TaxID=4023 RepID=A0AAD5P2S0_ACENE|nr:hypothetical protein LWI28_021986 [Acer negundo]
MDNHFYQLQALTILKSKQRKTMYPKVKVREEKNQDFEEVAVDHKINIESLSLHVSSSPEKEHRDVSPPFIARVPKSYATTNVVTPTISSCKEKIDENDKPNIRATPILRPRAVLSSPDNDAVIGNKNRNKAERPTALKNRNPVQNRHLNVQCKVIPSRVIAKSQKNTNSLTDTTTTTTATTDNKSDLKGKKGPTVAVSSQRRYLRTGKSGPVKT